MQKMELQSQGIQEVRRLMSTFDILQIFVRDNITQDLIGFRPLQQCVDALVSIDTCGRCVATRPQLCENVCDAVARACYSPFNDALSAGRQMERLWNIVKNAIDRTSMVLTMLEKTKGFFNGTSVVSSLS